MSPEASRAFAQAVKLFNPGAPRRDADDTTWLPGQPAETDSMADLWQLSTEQQVLAVDGTVVADWAGIFPPGSAVAAQTTVHVVSTGALFRVHGQPELLASLLTGEPDHIEARLKFISDQQQGATS